VAVQAEKSTNVSVSLLERRSEIKRIADEKVSLKKAQDQLQETLEREKDEQAEKEQERLAKLGLLEQEQMKLLEKESRMKVK